MCVARRLVLNVTLLFINSSATYTVNVLVAVRHCIKRSRLSNDNLIIHGMIINISVHRIFDGGDKKCHVIDSGVNP